MQILIDNQHQSYIWAMSSISEAYPITLAEDFPETDPQQDLYFVFEPQGHALFLGIFNKKKLHKKQDIRPAQTNLEETIG